MVVNVFEFSIAASKPSMSGSRPTFVGDGFLTTRDFGGFDKSFKDRFEYSLNNLTQEISETLTTPYGELTHMNLLL